MIKDIRPELPVIMVTKNEDEGLMEQAIGTKISDYLTKPVNPSQVLLACKKFLEGKKIAEEHVSRDYIKEFNEISAGIQMGPDADGWVAIYEKLTNWSMELDAHPESGLRQTLNDQMREANVEFSKFIERNYRRWLESQNRPTLSVDVVEKYHPRVERTIFNFLFRNRLSAA